MLDSFTVTDDCTALDLRWDDGSEAKLSAATLRKNARDAASIRQLYDNDEIFVEPGLKIEGTAMVGRMGVNIAFSDGHDRAIYPFPYLRDLCGRDDN